MTWLDVDGYLRYLCGCFRSMLRNCVSVTSLCVYSVPCFNYLCTVQWLDAYNVLLFIRFWWICDVWFKPWFSIFFVCINCTVYNDLSLCRRNGTIDRVWLNLTAVSFSTTHKRWPLWLALNTWICMSDYSCCWPSYFQHVAVKSCALSLRVRLAIRALHVLWS